MIKLSLKIKAVELMREIRNKLSEEYLKNPEKEIFDLKKIREKYQKRSYRWETM